MTIEIDKFTNCQLTDIEDVWISLNTAIAAALGSSLDYFIEHQNGYPGDSNEKEWNETLSTIRDGFKAYNFDHGTESCKKVKESFALLANIFDNLWD